MSLILLYVGVSRAVETANLDNAAGRLRFFTAFFTQRTPPLLRPPPV